MQWLDHNGLTLHWREDGPLSAPPILFLNSLGTDLRLWDGVVDHLPDYRVIRMDNRGHGLSDVPDHPFDLAEMAGDAAALIAELDLRDLTVVGVSVGGMMAQSLAVQMPDRIARVVLSNSAPRMGDPAMWQDRIAAVRRDGLSSIAEAVLGRWFGPGFRAGPEIGLWRNMLTRTPDRGYAMVCEAIAAADWWDLPDQIGCPALVIAGGQDGASPPDIVKPLADAIAGASYVLIESAGHLPMVDARDAFVAHLRAFLPDPAGKAL